MIIISASVISLSPGWRNHGWMSYNIDDIERRLISYKCKNAERTMKEIYESDIKKDSGRIFESLNLKGLGVSTMKKLQ